MVSIGKVNIGRKEKRAFFPLNHDVNTTSDFGFCQPTLIRHFIKGSKISLKSRTYVRLAPLPVPTFGRIECKQHTAFVPVKEVFEAFEYQQSNKSVSSALRSYVPVTTDYCTNSDVLRFVFDLMASISPYFQSDFNKWLSLLPFRLSLWVPVFALSQDSSTYTPWNAVINVVKPDKYIDIFNDVRIYGEDSPLSFEEKMECYVIGMTFVTKLREKLDAYFSQNGLNYQHINYDDGSVSEDAIKLPLGLFSYPLTSSSLHIVTSGGVNYAYKYGHPVYAYGLDPVPISGIDYTLNDTNQVGFSNTAYQGGDALLDGLSDSRLNYIFNSMSVENADFMFKFQFPDGFAFPVISQHPNMYFLQNQSIALGVHLTPNGKRLFKVFNACRYNFGRTHNVSLNSILSYYKAWFDKYNAGRNIQWRDTNAYKLIHTYYDTGIPSVVVYNIDGDSSYDFISDTIAQNVRYNILHFLTDIYDCVYCSVLDNITVATDSPILENTFPDQSNYIDVGSGSSIVPYTTAGTEFELPFTRDTTNRIEMDDSKPYYESERTDSLSVRMLQTLYKLVNKNSVLGAKVDDYLRAHGIANGLPKTKVLGDTSFMCNLDEVFGTVNNDSTQLGEYAGKGAGFSDGEKMKFECEEFGYLIQFTTLVPLGGYVQGDTQDPITRYDFYQSEFDGLGMEVLPQSAVIGRQTCFSSVRIPDSVFGFVPRYTSLKVQNNLANGGFSFNSESAQFLPYSLDKIFSVGSPSEYIDKSYTLPITKFCKDVVCDEELRYIGRYEKYGNFDRIFYDTTGITDNFIVHIIQDLSMYAPMRAIDNSFETYDEFNDDSSVKLDHA